MTATGPLVRVVDAGLGHEAQVRLVVSGISDPDRLQRAWAASGATLERSGERIHAVTTVQALARAAGRSLEREEAQLLEAVLERSVAAWSEPSPDVPLPGGRVLACMERPLVMGVVNVSPDSFSDGGLLYPGGHPQAGIDHGLRLIDEGADVIDVGGESTRPGAEPVDEQEELDRVLPVIEGLAAAEVPISIDTTKASVARAAIDAGATIVNDVSGARDPELLASTAESGAAYVLMHTRGTPQTMGEQASYADVVAEVYEFLNDGLARCDEAGIEAERVLVDPGIGFAKDADHSLELLRSLRQLRGLGRPVVVGASRKSFIGMVLDGAEPDARLEGSLACTALAVERGASVIRVHDVAANLSAARVAYAVVAGRTGWSSRPS